MTVIVGIFCRDGIVIGTDSSATFTDGQIRTVEQETEKIDIIQDHVIIAGTGQTGLGQRFVNIVEKAMKANLFNSVESAIEAATELAKSGIQNFSQTNVQRGAYGALVAFPFKGKPCLCEFTLPDFQPEMKNDKLWYVSMGGGQLIGDPFLGFMRDVFWRGGPPSLNDGMFSAVWTLHHAIQVNPGGIKGPIHIATLRYEKGKLKAQMVDRSEIEQHLENVEGACEHLRKYADILRGKYEAPDVPKP